MAAPCGVQPPPPSDCSENHLIWMDSIRTVPLACCKIPFEYLFRMVQVHNLLSIYSIFFNSDSIQFLFFVQSKNSVKLLYFLLNFHFQEYFFIIIWLLSDYCSVLWSCKCIPGFIPLTTTDCQVNKHHENRRFAYFCLCIGFMKGYCHHWHSWDLWNQVLWLGSRSARQYRHIWQFLYFCPQQKKGLWIFSVPKPIECTGG